VIIALAIGMLLISSSFVLYSQAMTKQGGSARGGSILVPLYSGNASQFEEVIGIREKYGNVHVFVIINPDNGPGNASDPSLYGWVDRSEASGITVLGYVYTDYGQRPTGGILEDIHNYTKWYNIHAIFFDEVSDNVSLEPFYSNLVAQSRLVGVNFTVGNPGDFVPGGYLSIFNITVIYENLGYPSLSALRTYGQNESKGRLAVIAYGVPFSPSEIVRIGEIAGVDYFSDQSLPDPYQKLSSYIQEIASAFN
jgi:hypothetical protein